MSLIPYFLLNAAACIKFQGFRCGIHWVNMTTKASIFCLARNSGCSTNVLRTRGFNSKKSDVSKLLIASTDPVYGGFL